MAFEHADKKPGDLIRSADWNVVGTEVVRLGIDKISRAGEESLEGPLTVRGTLSVAGTAANGVGLSLKGELTVGTPTAGAAVRVLRRQEDGREWAHGALVLGTESPASAALRIGYSGTYSWLQGHGQQAIAINPHGGNVGIGTGTTAPAAKLHVEGDLRVTGALGFGNVSRQMVNLWGTAYGIGVQSFTTYLRTDGNFAFYKGGTHNDAELNPGGGTALAILGGDGTLRAGAFRFGNNSVLSGDQGGSIELGGDNYTGGIGTPYIDFHFKDKQEDYNVRLINNADRRLTLARGALWLDGDQEIFFADNGQIRSADNNHRILFRRSEDIMELREFGKIVFSPGSRDGKETARATLDAGGTFTCIRLTQTSTREVKRDIAPLDQGYAADLLDGLEPVRYRMLEDPDGDEHLGFVAEEVPHAIAGADHRTIHPGYIVAVLTRVVKEQQRRLNELTHRLEQGLSA